MASLSLTGRKLQDALFHCPFYIEQLEGDTQFPYEAKAFSLALEPLAEDTYIVEWLFSYSYSESGSTSSLISCISFAFTLVSGRLIY